MNIDFAKVRGILSAPGETLLEADVYDLLEACGLTAPKRALIPADQVDQLTSLPDLPGEYVYLKLQAHGLLHKTEAGAVQRTANTPDAVKEAAQRMIARCGIERDRIHGILIVESVEADRSAVPVELLLGARRLRDFGPIVAIGIGGVGAEFWNPRLQPEHSLRMASAVDMDEHAALRLLQTVAMRDIWAGYRGADALVDDAQLAKWVVAIAALIEHFDGSSPDRSPRIVEAEINPLVIRDRVVYPLDGLIRIERDVAKPAPIAPADGLRTLLHPKTVAIAGVSGKGMNPGRVILRNLLKGGFTTDQLAILKPGGGEVDDVACYETVSDIPFNVDLLILAVDAQATVQVLKSAAGKVKSALLIAGGTSERAEGKQLGERLAQAIDDAGIAAVGPNCLGIISRPAGMDTLFIPYSKIPRGENEPGNLAYISQSGAFMITRMNRMTRLEPRYAISTGNQLRTGVSDALAAVADDPQVKTFAVYVEGFGEGDGLRFCDIARQLTSEGRRVILYKGGRTSAGATAASGHTASLATDFAVCKQLAESAGVLVADRFETFEDLVQLATCWAGIDLGDKRIAMVSNAGYETVGMADNLNPPLTLAALDEKARAEVTEALALCNIDRLVDVNNPADLTPMATADVWCGVTEAILSSDAVDLAAISIVPPTPALHTLPASDAHREDLARDDRIAARLGAIIAASEKPVACCVDCGPLYDAFADELAKRVGPTVPIFRSADRMLRAVSALAFRAC
ncbi:MAG: acetate--CoA ligase family protein [Phycisphaerales bacterium]|nr:acetate--CoA ligase family protein [Phycisphaerales bacterium]